MSSFRARIFFPGPYIIKLEHGSAPKLSSRLYQAPHEHVIISFYSPHAAKTAGRFSPVPTYRGINQVVVPGNVPAAAVRVNAITFISVCVTKSIVLYE